MRKLFIAIALALTTLSACGLYFGEKSQSNQQIPDAADNGGGDAGWDPPDADHDGGNPPGCGDAGIHPPDAPDLYLDAQPWYPDAPVDAP
jgi:hypothetical protein